MPSTWTVMLAPRPDASMLCAKMPIESCPYTSTLPDCVTETVSALPLPPADPISAGPFAVNGPTPPPPATDCAKMPYESLPYVAIVPVACTTIGPPQFGALVISVQFCGCDAPIACAM